LKSQYYRLHLSWAMLCMPNELPDVEGRKGRYIRFLKNGLSVER